MDTPAVFQFTFAKEAFVTPANDPDLRGLTFLKQVPLFAALRDSELALLRQDLQTREYAQGQVIFQQGDPSGGVYIIARGKVRIFRVSPSGEETTITIFGVGDLIGELAALDELPRSATASAIRDSRLLLIPAHRFAAHVNQIPALTRSLVNVLAEKLRWTAAYAETIAQYDAAGRLLHILLLYNERFGEAQEPGKRYILDLGLNQSDLASLVGVRREWLNHILQEWSRRGLINYAAGKIMILDLPRVVAERDSRIEARLQ
jgi:CRP-like cAMP-binding protein